jgi:hypothetical protein
MRSLKGTGPAGPGGDRARCPRSAPRAGVARLVWTVAGTGSTRCAIASRRLQGLLALFASRIGSMASWPSIVCSSEAPLVRRVSSRTRVSSRASACGAMRRPLWGRGDPTAPLGWRLAGREAEAQELAPRRSAHPRGPHGSLLPWGGCALGRVHPKLEAPGDEAGDARHHPFARPAAAHVDVAVVGIANEAPPRPAGRVCFADRMIGLLANHDRVGSVPCPARPASGSTARAKADHLPCGAAGTPQPGSLRPSVRPSAASRPADPIPERDRASRPWRAIDQHARGEKTANQPEDAPATPWQPAAMGTPGTGDPFGHQRPRGL